MLYKTTYKSPIGLLTLASDGENLVGLWIEGQKYFGAGLGNFAQENGSLKIFLNKKNWLDRYFCGERPEISELPLAPRGSQFRQAVWKILCGIPYGKVTTYGEIAKKIAGQSGKNMCAQAVGGAVGHNPISVIIPCHRVVAKDGRLTGYAGGIENKIKLLELENADMS